MVVPVTVVFGVPVSVVHIVHMPVMRHCHMAAPFAVPMRMATVRGVAAGLALIHVVAVDLVQMTVVHIVHMPFMRDGHMAAARTVVMRVVRVGGVRSGHGSLQSFSEARPRPVPPGGAAGLISPPNEPCVGRVTVGAAFECEAVLVTVFICM